VDGEHLDIRAPGLVRALTVSETEQTTALDSRVGLLVTLTCVAATAAFVPTLSATAETLVSSPWEFVLFLLLVVGLQLFSVEGYGGGHIGVAAVGMLAAGFVLGPGPAMAIAILTPLVQWRRGRLLHRTVFDSAQLALAAGLGAVTYHALERGSWTALPAALAAGAVYATINNGLLCVAIGTSESRSIPAVWRERFGWARFHYLSFGALALGVAFAYQELGIVGMAVFALPPVLALLSVRQYVEHTRTSVEEIRAKNAEVEARNDDLRALFELAGGLAARAHDQDSLLAYAQAEVSRLTGQQVLLRLGDEGSGDALVAGGKVVARVQLDGGGGERWLRLRETLLPQLATAIESTSLVEKVQKTLRDTIAALSRSMEAKDYYTGGHTERVAEIAGALARRLGYSDADASAIEIGALLHDIGKIGIPERVLHKPSALDEEEWALMKRHPIISDYILAEIDLHPFVRQIARSTHERLDGKGYPDGLSGEDVPLPARIVLVADAFDALTSDRPYRVQRPTRDALEEIEAHAGTQFCPTVVDALQQVFRERPELFAGPELRVVA
jgi:putative nucleotidyltransferase with HDIG domain